MPKQSTFKVSRKGVEPFEVNFVEPENLQDPRWAELGIDEGGINELAVQNLVIKIQGGARGRLDDGLKAVQEFVDNYKYGQRVGGGTKKVVLTTEQVQTAGFSEDQLAMLKAAGVSIPGLTDQGEEPSEDGAEGGSEDEDEDERETA